MLMISLAFVNARSRFPTFQIPSADHEIQPLGRNWLQGFYKSCPELKARRIKAVEWAWHDRNVYGKGWQWLAIIGFGAERPCDHIGQRLSCMGQATF